MELFILLENGKLNDKIHNYHFGQWPEMTWKENKMKIEINENFIKANDTGYIGSKLVMVTPPLDENYWIVKVSLSDNQAIVGFPKFGTIGIGFQVEEDWNTNLPYQCSSDKIYKHIRHNKGNDEIFAGK